MKREQKSEEQKCTGYENRPRRRGKNGVGSVSRFICA